MSQQGPGGYGGGGPFGPPGGGGPPPGGGYPPGGGGYPPGGGAPPGGYGPPGYGPPAAPPPGYGPPQPGYGAYPGGPAGPPPPRDKRLLYAGIGCGLLFVLSIVAGIAGYFYVQSQKDTAIASAVAAASGVGLGATPGATLSPSCAKAVACCKKLIVATVGSNANAALIEQACGSYGSLPEISCAAAYPSVKKQAAERGASCE